jgi:decaprenylphospho-beta-D-ribofuranose 2-oxidase
MSSVRWKSVELAGWGRVRRARSLAARAERTSDLAAAISQDRAGGISIYASGRSYGDSALNSNGHSCLTGRLNRILGFDEASGIVEVEPGVTFRQLMDVFLPKGWLVPVTPGTSFATIAGAVAHDVHGKNHESDGSFGQHVTEIDLMTPDGSLRTLGPRSRPAWFRATCGGCGLTGVMTRIAFRMRCVPGGYVRVTKRRLGSLDAFLEAFEGARDASYSVGWIDALAVGPDLGRGILETAEPASEARPVARSKHEATVPFELPLSLVNPMSVKAFNALYFHSAAKEGTTALKPYRSFLYPLDAIGSWNGSTANADSISSSASFRLPMERARCGGCWKRFPHPVRRHSSRCSSDWDRDARAISRFRWRATRWRSTSRAALRRSRCTAPLST